jgi:hypothetical protein
MTRRRGRPRTNTLPRAEQLRLAKHKQRTRERKRGLATVALKLPRAQAQPLRLVARLPGFEEELREFLEERAIRVDDYPLLRDLLWTGRRPDLLPAREAFETYQRNSRFVNPAELDDREKALIDRLRRRYGADASHA